MIKIGIIGGSGYTGGELIRILYNHPNADIVAVTSRKLDGKKVSNTHTYLHGFIDLKFENLNLIELSQRSDLVFTAVPHGAAMKIIPELLDNGIKVIDLSADYRLPYKVFEEVYKLKHTGARDSVYGLTELHPEVSKSNLIANPGCYPTGAVLAVAPLVSLGLVENVIFDSKSGISGAGIDPTEVSHYPNMAENVIAYKITTHRHKAEIVQELQKLSKNLKKISFTPHVIPAIRGIFTTAHVFVKETLDEEKLKEIYTDFYKNKPFIRVIDGIPNLSAVRGSNFCDIGFEIEKDSNRVVVMSAIDNLVKGASGQAIQNMNIRFGLPEITGLWIPAVSP